MKRHEAAGPRIHDDQPTPAMNETVIPRAKDDRPPICPACGVTMGMIALADGTARYACLECGFSDDDAPHDPKTC